jgi:hypothetical protein
LRRCSSGTWAYIVVGIGDRMHGDDREGGDMVTEQVEEEEDEKVEEEDEGDERGRFSILSSLV